jgi:histidinol-phosphate aminotransferase
MNKNLIRKDILDIEAYKPGKPIEEVERELGLKGVIKIASNENPLGPSPLALKAVRRALNNLNRYPEGTCFYLKKKLARVLGVKEDNLIFGNGSDELIDIILKTIKAPQAEIVTSDTTFVEYRICAAINDFVLKTVPLKDFKFDLKAMKAACTRNTKAVFIANPNNPTGTYVSAGEVTEFLDGLPQDILVVFDEAYTEYVTENDFPKMIPSIKKRNIAILRTFSKIYGLAGLRIGYMIADEEFVNCAQRVRQPFNVNSLAQAAAAAALDDKAFVNKTKTLNLEEKKFLTRALAQRGIWFKESAANFIFVRMDTDTRVIFQKLLRKGVIIREMSSYNLDRYARITIGTRAENRKLIKALDEILKGAL